MIEVFKTNIQTVDESRMVGSRIQQCFRHYKVNFDLQDIDRILRIESAGELINADSVADLLHTLGFHGEVLPDEISLFEFDLSDQCRLGQ